MTDELLKVLEYYKIEFDKKIVCPFHGDLNPSLALYPENNRWYCFGCEEGGNAFDFVKKMEALKGNKNGLQVLLLYNRITNGSLSKTSEEIKKYYKQPPKDDYFYNMMRRGAYNDYSDYNTIDWYNVDEFFGEDSEFTRVKYYMLNRGFTVDSLNKFGAKPAGRFKSHPLMLPIFDNDYFMGTCGVAYKPEIREKQKYFYNKGFRRAKTLAGSYHRAKNVLIVEGFIDMLMAKQLGVKNVVSVLGWKMSDEQIEKLKSEGVKTVICGLDNDKKGKEGNAYLHKKFDSCIDLVYLDGMKDFGDLKGSEEKFKQLLKKNPVLFQTLEMDKRKQYIKELGYDQAKLLKRIIISKEVNGCYVSTYLKKLYENVVRRRQLKEEKLRKRRKREKERFFRKLMEVGENYKNTRKIRKIIKNHSVVKNYSSLDYKKENFNMGIIDSIKRNVEKAGSSKERMLYVKSDSKVRIRFLQDFDDGFEFTFHDSYAKGVNSLCQEELGKNCPLCGDEELRTRTMYAWTVYNYENNSTELMLFAVNQCTPVAQFMEYYETNGTMLDRDYVLSKKGKGQSTSYIVMPQEKRKFREKANKPFTKSAMLKILNKAYPCEETDEDYDEDYDVDIDIEEDDNEEENNDRRTKKTSKSSGNSKKSKKPVKSSRRAVEDDVDEDEEEYDDVEESEGDEEEYAMVDDDEVEEAFMSKEERRKKNASTAAKKKAKTASKPKRASIDDMEEALDDENIDIDDFLDYIGVSSLNAVRMTQEQFAKTIIEYENELEN